MIVDLPEPDGPNRTVTPGRGDLERDIHLIEGKRWRSASGKAHRPSSAFNRLPIHSDNNSPISASVSETSDSSAAFASPPGT